jgi:murein DD-endopeptidase MepM/ murein hydrolase activator NlpD
VRGLFLLLVLVLIAPFVAPYIKDAVFTFELVRQPAPSTLQLPVAGIPEQKITNSWQAPREGGRQHQGIDIFAPKGTAVQSTTRGVIWKVGQNRLGGNAVWVLGPGGQIHYYAHLDHFAPIKPRDRVAEGAVLGYVGNTGNARGTPPHLHYGIYSLHGQAINPYPLLSHKKRSA